MEGSKTLTTTIATYDVVSQVHDDAWYIGESLKANAQAMELAARLQASTDDGAALRDFIRAAASKLAGIVTKWVGRTSLAWNEQETEVTFTTKTVANFMAGQANTLKEIMQFYLAMYTMAEWLKLLKPDEAERYTLMLPTIEEDIKSLGAQRAKPSRS